MNHHRSSAAPAPSRQARAARGATAWPAQPRRNRPAAPGQELPAGTAGRQVTNRHQDEAVPHPHRQREASAARIRALDVARGLSVSLVVLGHTPLPAWLNAPLSVVRLPLLFLISGYLFNWARYRDDARGLASHRFHRLMVPYAAAGLLTYAFWLIARRPVEPAAAAIPWYRPLLGLAYGSSRAEWLAFNLPLWFLPASFCGQLAFRLLLGVTAARPVWIQGGAFFLVGAAGAAAGRLANLPWSLDIALVAQPFFWTGWRLRQAGWLRDGAPLPAWAWLGGGAALALALALNGPVAVNSRAYGALGWFYAGGIGGSLVALRLAQALAGWRPAERVFGYLGRHSLVVLGFHVGLAFPLLSRLLQLLRGDPWLSAWGLYWGWGLAVTAALAWAIRPFPWLVWLLEGQAARATAVPTPRRAGQAARARARRGAGPAHAGGAALGAPAGHTAGGARGGNTAPGAPAGKTAYRTPAARRNAAAERASSSPVPSTSRTTGPLKPAARRA